MQLLPEHAHDDEDGRDLAGHVAIVERKEEGKEAMVNGQSRLPSITLHSALCVLFFTPYFLELIEKRPYWVRHCSWSLQ